MAQTMNRSDMPALKPQDEWVANVDVPALQHDFRALGANLAADQGQPDLDHLQKMRNWTRLLMTAGVMTMWLPAWTLVSALMLSTANFFRWILAHHIQHGGYTNEVARTERESRWTYARGWRRMRDWPDWILPEAWDIEHNHSHHYSLNEDTDPDLVERNLQLTRSSNAPYPLKLVAVIFSITTWKWFYYAVNTFYLLKRQELKMHKRLRDKMHKDKRESHEFVTLLTFFQSTCPEWFRVMDLLSRAFVPYIFVMFVALPSPFLLASLATATTYPIASTWLYHAYYNALITLVLAEVFTNAHSFLCIVTNHAGLDMYRYKTHAKPLSAAFYIRAVVSSANYDAGSDGIDYLHGWLNYQIEHHCFPKLSMLSYQRAMPLVKKLAQKHGVPYVQESVFIRLKKTVDSMTGETTMRSLPVEWEEYLNGNLVIQD